MKSDRSAGGIAFLCDRQGTILEVMQDDLGLDEELVQGRPLALAVDRASMGKSLNFLVELREHGVAFDWELNLPIAGRVTTLHFAGGIAGDNLLVIGARSQNGVLQLYEDMMRISNEQANALRATTKEQSEMVRRQVEMDNELYDEISRLNNELVTLQRELAKKNVEQERLNEELQRLHELKNIFLGIAAHDLRGPLGNIRLMASVLLDMRDTLTVSETEKLLGDIEKLAEYMLTLVADLLDVSQIEAGRLDLKFQSIDLGQFLDEAIERHNQLAAPKNTRIWLEEAPARAVVEADPLRLRQVIDNFISNAVKYSPTGSSVYVNARPTPSGWRVNVRDEGPGITLEDQKRLFQEFTRLATKPTGGEKSVGLGLAITRRIVEAHGGQVGVDSEFGRGATFWFVLPDRPAHLKEDSPKTTPDRTSESP